MRPSLTWLRLCLPYPLRTLPSLAIALPPAMNQLDALKELTTVVADTGDFKQLGAYKPTDATTNPSLILKAVQQPDYAPLLKDAVARFRGKALDEVMDRLLVRFGCEILAII